VHKASEGFTPASHSDQYLHCCPLCTEGETFITVYDILAECNIFFLSGHIVNSDCLFGMPGNVRKFKIYDGNVRE